MEKNLISQYNVDIHKANTKNPIKDVVREKHKIKKQNQRNQKTNALYKKRKRKFVHKKNMKVL